jgi:hypothetical protein
MSDADKPTDAANIVAFGKPPTPQTQADHVKRERAFIDTTRAVAKLAQLSRLEYERARSKAAKEIGCRVSFLDRVIANIHEAIQRLKNDYDMRSFAREHGERLVNLHVDDNTATPAWQLATAEDIKTGVKDSLLLLADGNFTVKRGVPRVKKPEPRGTSPSRETGTEP